MYRSDPCYKFTWALDVCVRENSTDYRHLKEIETALDGLTTASAYGYEARLSELAHRPHASAP